MYTLPPEEALSSEREPHQARQIGAAIDAWGESFTMRYAAVALTTRRIGAASPGQ